MLLFVSLRIVYLFFRRQYNIVKNFYLKISSTSFGDVSLHNVAVTMLKNDPFANSSGAKSGLAIPQKKN